jgi:neutral trehalase
MEPEISADTANPRLFLPFPYLRISADSSGIFQEQFAYDTAFMNYALFAHDRLDIARYQILNHLVQIERYGYAPNANNLGVVSRSQLPLMPATIWCYYKRTKGIDLVCSAYPSKPF